MEKSFCFIQSLSLSSQLATVADHNLFRGFAVLAPVFLNFLYDVHSCRDRTKHYMLTVQPRSLYRAQKELRAISVRASVGHGEDARASMLERKILVDKFVAEDRLATSAIVSVRVRAVHVRSDDGGVGWGCGGWGRVDALTNKRTFMW